MSILAIDPGPVQSAYVILDGNLKPVMFGIEQNQKLLDYLPNFYRHPEVDYLDHFALEMVACMGMAVGKEVFETVFWIGRFWERAEHIYKQLIYRKDIKMHLCNSVRAKDSNIRQALIDRFGVVGVKANKGWFYGVSKDVWAAVAVGVTYHDIYLKGEA